MILRSCNKVSANEFELEIAVGPEEFNKEVDKIYKRDIKKISVPGFRKGKAPRAFVEKYYGEGVFFEDAIKNIYPGAISDAAKEANIELIGVTKLDIVTSSKKEGLVFKANVVVYPEVKLGEYKGIEVKKVSQEVTKEDIDNAIEEVRIRNGRLVTVEDRPAKIGDTVVIDFKGFIDDEEFDGGSADNFTLELGKGQFIAGFEEQIAGHNTGERFEINVKFPEDYHAKRYAGKDAVFKVHLHEIKERELPDLDDEFVKDVSEFDTLDEYKEDLKKNLEKEKKENATAELENEIADKLIKITEAEIPDIMINEKVDELLKEFEYRLQAQGINIKEYTKFIGTNVDEIKDELRPQAEKQVRLSLALRKISELENIVPSEEDVDKEYDAIAAQYKMDKKRVKMFVSSDSVKNDIKSQKALEIVKDSAIIK